MGTHTTIKGRKKVTSEEARASCESRTIVGKSCCFCENQGGTEVRQQVLEGQHLSLAITCSSQGTLLQARVLQRGQVKSTWPHIQGAPRIHTAFPRPQDPWSRMHSAFQVDTLSGACTMLTIHHVGQEPPASAVLSCSSGSVTLSLRTRMFAEIPAI